MNIPSIPDTRTWAQMNGAGFPRYELPPVAKLPAPVAKAASTYLALLDQWRDAAAEVNGLNTKPARARAEAADTAAYAKAVAAVPPKPDPGEVNVRAYEDRLRAATRRKAATAQAVDTAAKALLAAVDEHRVAIDKAGAARLKKAEAAFLAHVDAFPAVALELAEARRQADWPADLERRQHWGRPLALPATVGAAPNSEVLARALRTVVLPPEPEPSAPKHITDDVVGGPRSKAAA